jgi:hypothetical protein
MHFEDLWEGFDNPSVLITVYLNSVNQGNLCLGTAAKRFKDRRVFLHR